MIKGQLFALRFYAENDQIIQRDLSARSTVVWIDFQARGGGVRIWPRVQGMERPVRRDIECFKQLRLV